MIVTFCIEILTWIDFDYNFSVFSESVAGKFFSSLKDYKRQSNSLLRKISYVLRGWRYEVVRMMTKTQPNRKVYMLFNNVCAVNKNCLVFFHEYTVKNFNISQ